MDWFTQKRVYLDYASATPVSEEVKKVMAKYWSEDFYNTSSIYEEGVRVKKEVEDFRTRVARAIGISSKGVIFTSGGTESDNLAILGIFEESQKTFKRPHVIVSAIEHPAVMACAEEVVRRGGEISIIPVSEEGIVSLEMLEKLIKRTTVLVSVGLANNEIGTIQPIAKIGRLLEKYRKKNESVYPYLHTDASQAPCFLNISLENLQADLLTLDGSKIYGPKGVGILATRSGVKLHRLHTATLNPSLIAGITLALEMAIKHKDSELKRVEAFREYFITQVTKRLPKAVINGSKEHHLPSIVSVSLPNTLSEFVLLKLDHKGVAVSVGSACSLDERISGSPVIIAIGKPELAEATLRISMGRMTNKAEFKRAVEIFCLVGQNVLK